MRLPIHSSQGQTSTSGRPFQAPFENRACSYGLQRNTLLARAGQGSAGEVTLLDYGAGNVRSVRNAVRQLGYTLKEVGQLFLPYSEANILHVIFILTSMQLPLLVLHAGMLYISKASYEMTCRLRSHLTSWRQTSCYSLELVPLSRPWVR